MVVASGAAAAAGVHRFLHVSAFPDAWRDRRMPLEFEHYMKVKREADVHLAATNLDWVIVRPGNLTDAPGTGRVRLGLAITYGACRETTTLPQSSWSSYMPAGFAESFLNSRAATSRSWRRCTESYRPSRPLCVLSGGFASDTICRTCLMADTRRSEPPHLGSFARPRNQKSRACSDFDFPGCDQNVPSPFAATSRVADRIRRKVMRHLRWSPNQRASSSVGRRPTRVSARRTWP